MRASVSAATMRRVRPSSSAFVPSVPVIRPFAGPALTVKSSMTTPPALPVRWAETVSRVTGLSAGLAPRSTASFPASTSVQAESAPAGAEVQAPVRWTAFPAPRNREMASTASGNGD